MGKKNVILKAWERCRSIGSGSGNKRSHSKLKATAKSLSENNNEKGQIAPHGCFSVHVGPERKRFIVKTEYVNHPLFQILLEEAEQEFGFESDGPIWLPCNVDLFYKVLAEMDGEENNNIMNNGRKSFSKTKGFSFFVLRGPAHLPCYGHHAYSVVDSEMLRIDQFQ
ncbi:auxin-responsive protein SAUR32-like [Abrus precatorius]|uniref:Auxin-responsive protein SAUR32-like n=1 Tax=Abrus precatorius TaxID=3816 RepID=A0A8B8LUN9_ABRPR|nr:auxin-responsive protein SAUR32-like [Abrus precatorius]